MFTREIATRGKEWLALAKTQNSLQGCNKGNSHSKVVSTPGFLVVVFICLFLKDFGFPYGSSQMLTTMLNIHSLYTGAPKCTLAFAVGSSRTPEKETAFLYAGKERGTESQNGT